MARSARILASAFLLLLFALPAVTQVPNSAGEQSPEALNALYQEAMKAKEYPRAIAAAQQLATLKANSQNLGLLAKAQLYSGAMDAALATYDQTLAAAEKEKPAEGQPLKIWNDGVAEIYISKGNTLLKLKRTSEAIEAYNRAAERALNPALAYFNVCAVLYNNGNVQEAEAACRKCVQADPTKANAWFILGSALFGDTAVDAHGKMTASPETREALEKYMALAPDGPHAADVKAMLEMIAK
jgi:tetratricopeptide (TPR) repeat protein